MSAALFYSVIGVAVYYMIAYAFDRWKERRWRRRWTAWMRGKRLGTNPRFARANRS